MHPRWPGEWGKRKDYNRPPRLPVEAADCGLIEGCPLQRLEPFELQYLFDREIVNEGRRQGGEAEQKDHEARVVNSASKNYRRLLRQEGAGQEIPDVAGQVPPFPDYEPDQQGAQQTGGDNGGGYPGDGSATNLSGQKPSCQLSLMPDRPPSG